MSKPTQPNPCPVAASGLQLAAIVNAIRVLDDAEENADSSSAVPVESERRRLNHFCDRTREAIMSGAAQSLEGVYAQALASIGTVDFLMENGKADAMDVNLALHSIAAVLERHIDPAPYLPLKDYYASEQFNPFAIAKRRAS